MVKPTGPGVYTATYSNNPVYEFQFGEGLKEHVMRRRHDDWINATHILKAAGFDKPARTRILEREVQKEMHEKVQGGYGKYQGTWVPLEQGQALAQRNGVYEKLRTIFEYIPGNLSPPPAPKHTTNKPKAPKKPAVPKWSNKPAPVPRHVEEFDNISAQLNDDESMPDDATVASASFMGDDDRYDVSAQSTGHRKRKRDESIHNAVEQSHVIWADELLDYFMVSGEGEAPKPEPPPNFQADWSIDNEGHSGMHWASAMGDVEVMKQLKRFGASLHAENIRGETPLMRAVLFTNCMDKQTMPGVVNQLISTIDRVDHCNATAIHHTAAITSSRNKHHCARYYLDIILNKMQEILEPEQIQRLIDAQDINGNTAIHIAAQNNARKCVRALIGRGASVNIPNNDNIVAEEIIQEINHLKNRDRHPQGSSSPFAAPESNRHKSVYDAFPEEENPRHILPHTSEAAISIDYKITPLVLEKFRELAQSFDDELQDKIESEKEANRLLLTTHEELNQIRHQTIEYDYLQDQDNGDVEQAKAKYAQLDKSVLSLIEQQQHLQLIARSQHEESRQNGHSSQVDDISERAMLARILDEEQHKRQKLVVQYMDALAMAGAGEKGEQYRRLISKCVDTEVDTMDENIDSLLEQLLDDQGGLKNEIHAEPL